MLYSLLKHSTRTSVRSILRRNASTATPAFVKAKRAYGKPGSFKIAWLSDPSCYPIIAVMGGAGALVLGVGTSCLMYNPDVIIKKQGSVIRPPVE
mmetsp:Transcript_15436/g.42811  ORF Transcript_15436/g.42811 Transcript_15436/m.42811 type:complete len:95 (-) Transcript_15436:238-522(-)